MKNLLFLFLFTAFSIVFIFSLQSCEDYDFENEVMAMTATDRFVSGPNFQAFYLENEAFQSKVRKIYATLSDLEKKKVDNLYEKISESIDFDDLTSLSDSLKILTNIDYMEAMRTSVEMAEKAFQDMPEDMSSKELVRSLQRYSICSGGVIRVKTRSESQGGLQGCLEGCALSEINAKKLCEEQHHHAIAEDKIKCHFDITSIRKRCEADCRRIYK